MTAPGYLMRLGMPSQQAKRLGVDSGGGGANLNGGAAFASATAIGQFAIYVRANAQTGANVYQMPNNAEIGTEFMIFNIGGTTGGVTANVYPPTGGTFNIGSASATSTLTTVATGKGIFLVAITASTFDVFLSA
jgi:hypothetical protein